ncbi:MAG: GIY-YIG nuclease family protein [Candidatus Omnitrophota bacterium]
MTEKQSYVYMVANKKNTVIYIGVTSDLRKRAYEHRHKLVGGFTKRYTVTKLVYYEAADSIESAIEREKRIKGGSRMKKLFLIKGVNPKFDDLYDKL